MAKQDGIAAHIYQEIVYSPSGNHFWWVRPGTFIRGPFRTLQDIINVRDFKVRLEDVVIPEAVPSW